MYNHSKVVIECPYCHGMMDCGIFEDPITRILLYQYRCRVCRSTGPISSSQSSAHDHILKLWGDIDGSFKM